MFASEDAVSMSGLFQVSQYQNGYGHVGLSHFVTEVVFEIYVDLTSLKVA